MKKHTYIKNIALQSNWKAFSFFLLFTFLIWLLVQFSQSYTYQYQLEIVINQNEVDKELETTTFSLPVEITDTGFKIVKHSWSNLKLEINSKALSNVDDQLMFDAEEYKSEIAQLFKLQPTQINLNAFSKKMTYVALETKLLPVKPQLDISYKKGYGSLKGVSFYPESIKISGPKTKLDSIRFLQTEKIVLQDLKSSVEGEIKILSKNESINIEQKTINYQVEVNKITEKKVAVPIDIINLPQAKEVTIFPKEIEISYLVLLEDYDRYTADNFRVVCNFNERFEEEGFMLVRLEESPNRIARPKFSVNKIDYLIID